MSNKKIKTQFLPLGFLSLLTLAKIEPVLFGF